jgi:U4/U6.U5 tri-snRNP-associated protein 3
VCRRSVLTQRAPQGKHIVGADVSAAKVNLPRRYRQYMNRRGGFNRPLDSMK